MTHISLIVIHYYYFMQELPAVHPHPQLDQLEQELACVKTAKLQEILVKLGTFAVLEPVLLEVETALEIQNHFHIYSCIFIFTNSKHVFIPN